MDCFAALAMTSKWRLRGCLHVEAQVSERVPIETRCSPYGYTALTPEGAALCHIVIASAAKQSCFVGCGAVDCFAALAMTSKWRMAACLRAKFG